MTFVPITSLLCAVCALALVGLSIPVVIRRFEARVSLGDGNDKPLRARIRAQANFVEYVPLALATIGLAEANGTAPALIWTCAVGLVLGRTIHAVGMYTGAQPRWRAAGMTLTWLALGVSALALARRVLG